MDEDRDPRLRVEVVYAEPGRVWTRTVQLAPGAVVRDAVDVSGLARERPDADVGDGNLGVFGRRVKPTHPLRDGDRVEVYRPLTRDPMEARRRRALRSGD